MHGAYILARFSTNNQNEASIETQVERCSEWCQAHGLPILDVFADYAISGMKESRPQYERMMSQLREGGADTVVIYDQSRLFRDMILWFRFRQEIEGLGVRVVSITQPAVGGDLRDPSIFLNEGVTALFNQMWVLQTQQKTLEGVRHRAESGKHTGGVPALGYRVENEYLVIDETEAQTVRMIFDMYAAGSGYSAIIKRLNSLGLKTKRGKPFGKNSLHDLLKNEKYVGRSLFGGKTKGGAGARNSHAQRHEGFVETSCPAIISQDVFEAVQKRLEENRRSSGRTATVMDQPLKGRIFCGECCSAMTLAYSYKKSTERYAYYKCAAKKRGLVCESKQIRKDELEETVAEVVKAQLQDAAARQQLLKILRESRDEIQLNAGPRMDAINAEMSKLDSRLNNATDAILNGLSSPALIDKINALEAERKTLQGQLDEFKKALEHSALDDARLERLLDRYIHATPSNSAEWLNLVVRVEVFPDFLKIWTIIDDDPPPKETAGLNRHQIHETVELPAEDIKNTGTYNCGCALRRTIIYTHSAIVIGMIVGRGRGQKP